MLFSRREIDWLAGRALTPGLSGVRYSKPSRAIEPTNRQYYLFRRRELGFNRFPPGQEEQDGHQTVVDPRQKRLCNREACLQRGFQQIDVRMSKRGVTADQGECADSHEQHTARRLEFKEVGNTLGPLANHVADHNTRSVVYASTHEVQGRRRVLCSGAQRFFYKR
jgi:hypothetical protein